MAQANISAFAAETLGTFILVFAGTGAIVFNDISGGAIGNTGIALTFGLVVLSVIYTFGEVSGAHINPAVTFGFWLSKRINSQTMYLYIIAQLFGAILASGVLRLLVPEHSNYGATLPSGGLMQSFILEVIITWWLVLVILNVSHGAKEKGIVAGILVGSVVAMVALFAGPISGASMNPARSFAPALVSGQLGILWLYVVATTIGAVLASFSCYLMRKDRCCGH